MKRIILLLAVIIYSLPVLSQTEEIELKNLSDKYASGEITLEQYRKMGKDWQDLIKFFEGFPTLPVNKEYNQVEFINMFEFPNTDKQIIYDRIMEWSAINFGNLSSVLHYSNFENGKIILKGFFEIYYTEDFKLFFGGKQEQTSKVRCNNTYVFTIKNNKLKMEVQDLIYHYFYRSYLVGSTYIPASELDQPIHTLYPITNSDPIEWKGRLDLLKQTNTLLSLQMLSLVKFINNRPFDYDF